MAFGSGTGATLQPAPQATHGRCGTLAAGSFARHIPHVCSRAAPVGTQSDGSSSHVPLPALPQTQAVPPPPPVPDELLDVDPAAVPVVELTVVDEAPPEPTTVVLGDDVHMQHVANRAALAMPAV